MLCKHGANLNKRHQKNGFTPLRIAIENQYAEAIKFILENPGFDVASQTDFQNISPFQAANLKPCSQDVMDIINKYMVRFALFRILIMKIDVFYHWTK